MGKNFPKVVVLILSYNGKHLLREAIASYLANDYPNFEVVVIDNGSTDNTREFVERLFPEVKVIRLEKNRGYSGGFNFGLDFAFNTMKADYVLISNNDVKADKNVIKELMKVTTMDDKIGFVSGKVYFYDKPDTLQTVGKRWHPILWSGRHIGANEKDTGQYENVAERAFLDDIFTLVPRKLYEETGGYDTDFYLQAEEFDWQVRAKRSGWKLYYTPHAKIWHKGSATIGGLGSPISTFFYIRNHIIVVFKHGKLGQKIRIWIYFCYTCLISTIKATLKYMMGRKARILPVLAQMLALLSSIKWIFFKCTISGVPKPIEVLNRMAQGCRTF